VARGPFQSGVEVWHINNDEAAEEFLRLCIRTVVDLPLPVAPSNHRRRLRRPQTRRRDHDACGPERFTVGFARRGHCAIAAFELFLLLKNK